MYQVDPDFTVFLKFAKLIPEALYPSSALLEAQEIFGLDFDPAELDQLEKEGLESDEEGAEGDEEEVRGEGSGMLVCFYASV